MTMTIKAKQINNILLGCQNKISETKTIQKERKWKWNVSETKVISSNLKKETQKKAGTMRHH